MQRLDHDLDGSPDVAYPCAWANLTNAGPHRLIGDIDQSLNCGNDLADSEHATCVAVPAIFDDGHIDVDDVALLQALVPGNSMADHMVDGRADRLGESPIVERRRDRP